MRNYVNKQFGSPGHLYYLIDGKYFKICIWMLDISRDVIARLVYFYIENLERKDGTFFQKTKQKELHLCAED